MKIARFIFKTIFFIILALDIAIFSSLIYLNCNLADEFKVKKGDTFDIDSPLPVTALYNGQKMDEHSTKNSDEIFDVDLKIFGIIPFSTVNVQVVDELQVVVLGNPFGMKLYTHGVLVVDMTDVKTEKGNVNPAEKAGIKKGDYILSVDGQNISTNEDLVRLVENSQGKKMKFEVMRDQKVFFVSFAPVVSQENGSYKIGIWVRDSSAGIGTLTFYSPATDIICGLGHGVCDEDTGEILNLDSGEIVTAEIFSVVKGKSGEPGQLKGKFTDETLGEIKLNCSGGVYSKATVDDIPEDNLTEIALKSEIKQGNAQILCTLDGSEPELFSCNITFKSGNYNADTQNMIVTVTDERLMDISGGIVQGLSGSPILQDGKLIGAVTHVLVDDPKKGYGIFAENMLENAETAAKRDFKEAS